MSLNLRISELSGHLQTLKTPEFYSDVEKAVESKDKDTLVKICRKAKIPVAYMGTVISALLSMSAPQAKYPEWV